MAKYNGLINVFKEAGYTSNDVVARLRGILKEKKIGHTGTLDPDAVGVLVCLIGNGTKLSNMLTDHDKEYIACAHIGILTNTGDISGEIINKSNTRVSLDALKNAVKNFTGEYDQIPPMYSAIKVNGKKLYELAREGIEIERKARRVNIKAIRLLSYEGNEDDIKAFTIEVSCSKGTYIRTLCEDIGSFLGTYATMASLVRTRVGNFTIDTAKKLDEIEKVRDDDGVDEIVLSIDNIFKNLDKVNIREESMPKIKNGNFFSKEDILDLTPTDFVDVDEVVKGFDDLACEIKSESGEPAEKKDDFTDGQQIRVYDNNDVFHAVYIYEKKLRRFRADKMFLPG